MATLYFPTSEQLAEIFTKALGQKQFQFLLSKLGVHNADTLIWGIVLGTILTC